MEDTIKDMISEIDFTECNTLSDAIYALYEKMENYIEDYDRLDITGEIVKSGSVSFKLLDIENTWINLEFDLIQFNDLVETASTVDNITIDLV
jgi:hypothetical protein